MSARKALAAAFVAAACSLALAAQAAPPEGKGPGNHASNPGKSSSAAKGNPHASGNSGRGRSDRGDTGVGNAGKGGPELYDRRGNGSRTGKNFRGEDSHGNLVRAGITATLAHEYALDSGLRGYKALPPGIRKNLARGKPLPPGIAKQMVPGSLLGRLPQYPGYEWRVAGTDLILISVASAVIADVLHGVFD